MRWHTAAHLTSKATAFKMPLRLPLLFICLIHGTLGDMFFVPRCWLSTAVTLSVYGNIILTESAIVRWGASDPFSEATACSYVAVLVGGLQVRCRQNLLSHVSHARVYRNVHRLFRSRLAAFSCNGDMIHGG